MSSSPCRKLPKEQIRLAGPEGQTAAMRCKAWDCPDCGPWLQARLEDAIHAAVDQRPELTRFFTLTLEPQARRWEQERQVERLSQARRRLREALARRYDERPTLLWVIEPHEDGTLHLHGLVDRYVPQDWLSEKWNQAGGGQVVDIRKPDVHRAARYLTKYLSKTPADLPDGTHRYGASQDLELEVRPRGDGTWDVQVSLGPAKHPDQDTFWHSAGAAGVALILAINSDRGPPKEATLHA